MSIRRLFRSRFVYPGLAVALALSWPLWGSDRSSEQQSRNAEPVSNALTQEARPPALRLPGLPEGQAAVRLRELHISIAVIGNIATTTMAMTFHNGLDRILEGELVFPLGDGQTVSRFAMSIGDKMREGVVVEKAKGRATFESIVRRGVDPGLLEWTAGNNFRARVYPIPANGDKTIIVAYEQELLPGSDRWNYMLPLAYKEEVEEFSAVVEVFNQDMPPTLDANEVQGFLFRKDADAYRGELQLSDYLPDQALAFALPVSRHKPQLFVEDGPDGSYFWLNVYPEVERRPRSKAARVGLFWDASSSAAGRDVRKELKVIDGYFEFLGDCEVDLVILRNTVERAGRYQVRNGLWPALKQKLKDTPNDGGSNMSAINLVGYDYACDEIILCSDGLSNFGGDGYALSTCAVLAVNSNPIANHALLRSVAHATDGRYLNLNDLTVKEAVSAMTTMPFRLVSMAYNSNEIDELYSPHIAISRNYALAGKLYADAAELTLGFGIAGAVSQSLTINIERQRYATKSGMVPRIWAQNKLAKLEEAPRRFQDAITQLGMGYGIVTRYTSLIVLDALEDYIRYDIEPLADEPEWRKTYRARKKQQGAHSKDNGKFRLDKLFQEWQQRKACIDRRPRIAKLPTKPAKESSAGVEGSDQSERSAEQIRDLTDTVIRLEIHDRFSADRNSEGNNMPAAEPEPLSVSVEEFESSGFGEGSVSMDLGQPALSFSPVSGNNNRAEAVERGDIDNEREPFYGDIARNPAEAATFRDLIARTTPAEPAEAEDNSEFDLQEYPDPYEFIAVSREPFTDLVDLQRRLRYPAEALRAKLEGRVVLRVLIGRNGEIRRTLVESSDHELFSEPAIEAIKESIFTPAIQNQRKVACWVSIPILFRLHSATPADSSMNKANKEAVRRQVFQLPVYSAAGTLEATLRFKEQRSAPASLLSRAGGPEEAYASYLKEKQERGQDPAFYFDAATEFWDAGEEKYALRILSNIAELELENHQLLRVLGRRLQEWGRHELAVYIFRAVLRIREEEPQSYRDLALALVQRREYSEAARLLYRVVTDDWDNRFPKVGLIALRELNALARAHGDRLNLSYVDQRLLQHDSIPLRVVIDWDTDNCDMDLWITGPNGERASYSNRQPGFGGCLSDDFTGGYGPEEFLLKHPMPGSYSIKVNYYGNRQQKVAGAVSLRLQIFCNYGHEEEDMFETTVRLGAVDEVLDLAHIVFVPVNK